MKKSFRKISLISLFLLCALVTAIVFLTVPKNRLDQATFWIAFVFAVPFNLACAVALHLWSGRKNGEDIVDIPLALVLVLAFGVIYLIVGAIFMYADITSTTLLIIIEAVITVAYIILAMYFTLSAKYVTDTQKETKQKVLFIRLLKADIDDLQLKAQTTDLKNALKTFSENVRFSDPMSHPSLSGTETELNQIVSEIKTQIIAGKEENALALVKCGEDALKSRNERCKILK